jgi:hypothetical protein
VVRCVVFIQGTTVIPVGYKKKSGQIIARTS